MADSRIDIVGSNGNNGEHYLAEEVAKRLAEIYDDDVYFWKHHMQAAIDVLRLVEAHNKE